MVATVALAACSKPSREEVKTKAVPTKEEAVKKDDAPPAERVGIEWVEISAGTYWRGSGDGDEGKDQQLSIPTFYIAKTLVTNKQYKACVDAGACTPTLNTKCPWEFLKGDQQPVVCVNWDQAKAFSEWVGGRLPSEAEWEYAARSRGKDQKYPWGDEPATCARAVITEPNGSDRGCGTGTTWPVCSKPAGNTEQGVCDMAGNASEWVQDWHHINYGGGPTDGGAWEEPAQYRVMRGGSFMHEAEFVRAAHREYQAPTFAHPSVSFRPALGQGVPPKK